MHDGGAVRNVAMWHVLIEGIDGMTLGFPATFQFPWIFGFKTFLFPLLWFLLRVLSFLLTSAITPILLWQLQPCSGDASFRVFPASTAPLFKVRYSFILLQILFLNGFLMSS